MPEMNRDRLRDGIAYAAQWVAYQQERRDLPGVVIAIRHEDDLLLSTAYGYADLERQTPMTPDHIFRIASHSKMFTATAVMQLVEGGKLRLDDPLADHLAWLRAHDGLARVTVRQALNHATGIIRDGYDADYWQLEHPFPDGDALRRLVAEGGAVLAPNESFKYSNIAYGLLGLVIEAVSGMPYGAYVTREIIERLALPDTGPDTDVHARTRLVTGYTAPRFSLPHRAIPDAPTGALAPATGFYSTAADLCRFAAAHFLGDETLLSDGAKREMQQPYWEVAHAETRYGLGFMIYTVDDRRFVGHGGAFPGQATNTIFDPKEHLVITVLVNEIGGPAGLLAQGAAKIIAFAQRQGTPDGSTNRARFTGRFATIWGVTDVAAFGNALVTLSPEADDPVRAVGRLKIEDDDTLRITDANGMGAPGETIRYVRDAGQVTKIVAGGMSAYPVAAYRARYGADGDAAHPW